jgi:hypothetical protein
VVTTNSLVIRELKLEVGKREERGEYMTVVTNGSNLIRVKNKLKFDNVE